MRVAKLLIPTLAILAACSDPVSTSTAQQALPQPTKAPPLSAAAMKTSFAPVVKRAAPAVVNVGSRRVVRQRVDPFWDLFIGGGVPRERVAQSLGSGAIVRADGVILTNNHNIEGADEV
ncbi:MAG TPA: serine protease, partial [Caulobacter sp.]|nr:serine protease [Caulobacter sp.]